MRILKKQLTIILITFACLLTAISSYELSIQNNATFPSPVSTFYFNSHLIYENSSYFYIIRIESGSSDNLLQIDQSHNNNISEIGRLFIDNFHINTFFISFNMKDYLGFIFNQESENGLIGAILIVNKQNFTQNYLSSLYSSYIAAEYLTTHDALLAISTYNEAVIIINPQNANVSINYGPFLVNNWVDYTDLTIIKSNNENYALIFSLQYEIFELLQLVTQSQILTSNIISQSLTNVSSVCFVLESTVVVHQNQTLYFYSLPNFDLVNTVTINQTESSYCYYDDITDAVIFVYTANNDTTFWAFSLNSSEFADSTVVPGYSSIYLEDRRLYLVDVQNTATVSYTFFDYQSCHHSYDYDPATFNCYQCPGSCSTCNSTQFCYDCFSGNYFIDDYCCGNSQYYLVVSSIKHCYNCPTGCYNCSSSSLCYICRANNYFIDDYCCGNSQYYLVANSTKSCHNCPSGCYNCSSSSFCYTCLAKNYFIDDYCCGVSQYYLHTNNTKSCHSCPSGCYNCSSSTYCYTCLSNNKLADNYCCGYSQYYLTASGLKSCHSCPTGCYNCSSSTYCYSCLANQTMINNFCCSVSQFYSNVNGVVSCQSCPAGCSNCTSLTSCSSCSHSWIMGINYICYNSTQSMLAGQYSGMQGGSTASTISAVSQNNFVSFFNSIPSLRGIFQSVFGSFLWFDELYLFQFHERDYGYHMNLTFVSIQEIQRQKWSGLNWMITDQFLSLFKTSITKLSTSIDYKHKYSSSHFISWQGTGEGLFANSLSFFATTILITLLFFTLLRVAFYLLFKHRWSMFFRCFSFWPYILVILMQGNLLQLVFFACGDLKLSFSLMFSQKISNIFSWFCLFFFTVFAVGMFSLLLSSYGHNAKYFCTNLKFKEIAIIYLTFQVGLRNLFQGMIHYFFKQSPYYQLQFILLILVEILLCVNYLYFIAQKCFVYKVKIWLSILQSIIKVVLIFFLYLRMEFMSVNQLNYKTDSILGFVVSFYLVLIYINLSVNVLILIREFVLSIYKKMEMDELERLKGLEVQKREEQSLLQRQKILKLKEAYQKSQIQMPKEVNQDRSVFFMGENRPVVRKQTNNKIVRIKRG